MSDALYEQGINYLCSDKSPIGGSLKVALENHTTPQCRVRTVVEGLYSWYKLSGGINLEYEGTQIYIPREFYLELSECLLRYANIVFNNSLEINFYRELIFQKWLDFSSKEFPYLVMDVHDRMKSLISEINDLVDKSLKRFICLGLLEKAEILFPPESINEAKKSLVELSKNFQRSRNKDIYGVMFVIEYYNKLKDADAPEVLKAATLKLGQNAVSFFKKNNIKVIQIKDFISSPKDLYQSYQFVLIGWSTPLEIQLKTRSMHTTNEDPSKSSSHANYKNTRFNNFLNGIVDEVCGVPPIVPNILSKSEIFNCKLKHDEILNDRHGITIGIPMFGCSRIYRTPNGEIPEEIHDLNSFEDMELLAGLLSKNLNDNHPRNN